MYLYAAILNQLRVVHSGHVCLLKNTRELKRLRLLFTQLNFAERCHATLHLVIYCSCESAMAAFPYRYYCLVNFLDTDHVYLN